ncbi:LPS export ABC transporter periplasmic protein LptC [Aromatoleum petrolei]|uniref:LPS export ABC transporter periplasmic protein LptC n=1 Tax=Aromatoleum petrolei TaxID=76116 RepID=A0ABX1MP64_9RHOO|nr:LPS export ABC transporter periplasmic protein LptC [Aromatoleum petrolei]NMF89747.1 LPS export ABC transporter periplasmic protein LptC [Aromatoleum petrolei]QTQ37390.1 Lipopolysaccharide export system family protein, LptC-like [Aromatoleum petrolei]
MKPSIQQLYPLAGLIIVAGASLWLERVTTGDEGRPSAQTRAEPDFIAERTRLIAFDREGRQHYELLADKITHHPQADVTMLERPRLRYEADGRQLHLSSEQGEVLREGEEVRLAGDVRARRDAALGSPEMTLASSSLTIWPDEERAATADPVALTQGGSTAYANGMKSDNIFGTLELIGNARVHIPRSHRNTP